MHSCHATAVQHRPATTACAGATSITHGATEVSVREMSPHGLRRPLNPPAHKAALARMVDDGLQVGSLAVEVELARWVTTLGTGHATTLIQTARRANGQLHLAELR